MDASKYSKYFINHVSYKYVKTHWKLSLTDLSFDFCGIVIHAEIVGEPEGKIEDYLRLPYLKFIYKSR